MEYSNGEEKKNWFSEIVYSDKEWTVGYDNMIDEISIDHNCPGSEGNWAWIPPDANEKATCCNKSIPSELLFLVKLLPLKRRNK